MRHWFIVVIFSVLLLSLTHLQITSQEDYSIDTTNVSSIDSAKINVLIHIAEKNLLHSPGKSIFYAERALSLARESNSTLKAAESLYMIGEAKRLMQQYSSALVEYSKAIKIASDIPDRKIKAKIQVGLAHTHILLGNISRSQSYLNGAIKISDSLDIKDIKIYANYCRALILKQKGYKNESLEILSNILKVSNTLPDKTLKSMIEYQIGRIFSQQKKHKKAISFYNQSLETSYQLQYKHNISQNLTQLGKAYLQMNLTDSAMKYSSKGIPVAKAIEDYESLTDAYEVLAAYFKRKNNYEAAFENLELHLAYKDSLRNIEQVRKISRLQKGYELERIEHENDLLKIRNEKQKMQLRQQKAIRYIIVFIAILAISLLVIVYFRYRDKNKANNLLQEKNTLINEKNMFLEVVINAIPNPFYYKEKGGTIIGCNKNFEKFLNLNKSQIIKKKETDLLPDYVIEDFTKFDDVIIRQGESRDYHIKLKLENGKIHEFIFYKSSYTNIRNEIMGIICLMVDVSELKESEAELIKSNKTKDKMFSIIGHDLLNPVGNLKNVLNLISKKMNTFDKSELENLIELSNSSANYTYNLLENILSWTRSMRGEIGYDPEQIYVNELVNSIFKLLEVIARNKKISLSTEISEDITCFGDKNLLSTALRNLISNAIKFTPQGGNVNVTAEVFMKEVEISVQDTGIGMTPEIIDKIFKHNQYYSSFGTDDEKGSGLGLRITKEFVEKNGGKIWAESKPGRGTKFFFSVPRKKDFFTDI